MSVPRFALVPIDRLLDHEEVDPAEVDRLVEAIRSTGEVTDPVWVAARDHVVLNGHHRVAALRRLGARRVPAWLFDYADETMALRRWGPGPPLSKAEVVRRARAGERFAPKTSRHVWEGGPLPAHPTPLDRLLAPRPGARRRRAAAQLPAAAAGPGRSRGA